jgi:heme/copper-type cytochrome/quinol oxidase subunit 3
MRDKLTALKTHIHNHRAKYAAGAATLATATVGGIFVVARAKEWNEFLEEHGVYNEFYQIEETNV